MVTSNTKIMIFGGLNEDGPVINNTYLIDLDQEKAHSSKKNQKTSRFSRIFVK